MNLDDFTPRFVQLKRQSGGDDWGGVYCCTGESGSGFDLLVHWLSFEKTPH